MVQLNFNFFMEGKSLAQVSSMVVVVVVVVDVAGIEADVEADAVADVDVAAACQLKSSAPLFSISTIR